MFSLHLKRKSHASATRHGDAFCCSFAHKMVPMPCGSEVMFWRKFQEIGSSDSSHFNLTDVLGQASSERRSLAAVSGD